MWDYWLVRAKKSSPKQEIYFGASAPRPYLMVRTEPSVIVDDKLIKNVIMKSYDNEPHENAKVQYKKYFEITDEENLEYQYSRTLFDESTGSYFYEKFIDLGMV